MIPRKFCPWPSRARRCQFSLSLFSAALMVTVSVFSSSSLQAANTANTYVDNTEDLMDSVNWSLGHLPTAAEDAVFPNGVSPDHSLNSANLTVGSLNLLKNSGQFTIGNNGFDAVTSVLTLGGATGTGNSTAGTAPGDLIYVVNGATLNLVNTNGGGGTGGLRVALGQTGNFNIAGTANVPVVVSGTGGLNKTGSGKLFLTNTANTFSGGLAVKAGTVEFTSSGTAGTYTNGGTGTITIGDSANSAAAATLNLNLSQGITYANPIASAGNGVNTINLANWFTTFSGPVTLGGDLVLSTTNPNNSTMTFTNTVSGTGNITTSIGGTNTGSNISFTNTLNVAGTLTNNGTGLASININGPVGSNFQGFIQNTATSVLNLWNATSTYNGSIIIKKGKVTSKAPNATGTGTITIGDSANTGAAATLDFNGNGAFTTNILNPISVVGTGERILSATSWNPTLSGAVTLNGTNLTLLSNNVSGSAITMTGGVTGTGNLVIQSNAASGTSDCTIKLNTGTINNTGTVTNSGTTTGTNVNTTIAAPIGANVTTLTQNSTNSKLILTGASPNFGGNVVVTLGTFQLTGSLGLKIGAAGVNSTITGAGTALFDGTFVFNTTNAAQNSSWTVVPSGGTKTYHASNFKVTNTANAVFVKSGTQWTYTNAGVTYKFDQATGVFSTQGTPSGFASWASDPANGLAANERAASYDADGDGFNNLQEYFFGGNPKSGSTAIAPQMTKVGNDIKVSFNRSAQSAADTTAVVQWSSDLVTWSAGIPVTTTGAQNITVPGTNAVNGKLFARVKITGP